MEMKYNKSFKVIYHENSSPGADSDYRNVRPCEPWKILVSEKSGKRCEISGKYCEKWGKHRIKSGNEEILRRFIFSCIRACKLKDDIRVIEKIKKILKNLALKLKKLLFGINNVFKIESLNVKIVKGVEILHSIIQIKLIKGMSTCDSPGLNFLWQIWWTRSKNNYFSHLKPTVADLVFPRKYIF